MNLSRQKEKREDIKEVLEARGYERVWDMSACEQDGQYFEGTGVLVLDRVNGVAYVNISERAHPDLAQRWATELGYKVFALTLSCTDFNNHVAAVVAWRLSCLQPQKLTQFACNA